MRALIEQYLNDHKTAWAETTYKTEWSRLMSVSDLLGSGPEKLFETVSQKMKPYSIKTLFIRIVKFEAWVGKETTYKDYLNKHRNRFKHAYKKEELDVTYDEAIRKIGSLPEAYREFALGLIHTGVRISEAYSISNGRVTGKGGKSRRVFGSVATSGITRSSLARALKSIGLKPHTLRKLCATKLASNGATPADLCKIFGWSSIGTSYAYLQSQDDNRLQELMSK